MEERFRSVGAYIPSQRSGRADQAGGSGGPSRAPKARAERADKGRFCFGAKRRDRAFLARVDWTQRQLVGWMQAELGVKMGTHWGISGTPEDG
jgi:hypothetical protein